MKIYKVGGWCRDTVMGLEPKDTDYVVVGATPEQMVSLGFEQVGADFPVFLHPQTGDEYALARVERKTGIGYKGFACEFSPSVTLEEDLYRRDTTMNAIAFDEETGQYIDPFNGIGDIKSGIIRHVSKHFAEDPLRILRVARFAARYGFEVHQDTMEMMKGLVHSSEFSSLADERIFTEFVKALGEKHSKRFIDVIDEIGGIGDAFGVSGVGSHLIVEQSEKIDQFDDPMDKLLFLMFTMDVNDIKAVEKKFKLPSDFRNLLSKSNQWHSDFDNIESIHKMVPLGESFTLFTDTLVVMMQSFDVMRRPHFFKTFVKMMCVQHDNHSFGDFVVGCMDFATTAVKDLPIPSTLQGAEIRNHLNNAFAGAVKLFVLERM